MASLLYDEDVSAHDSVSSAAMLPSLSSIDESNSNGLGSLADELAALGDDYSDDDDEEDDDYSAYDGFLHNPHHASDNENDGTTTSTSPIPPSHAATGSPKRAPRAPSDFSGSDYGDPDDDLIEPGGITIGLEEKLVAMERLTLHHRSLLHSEDAANTVIPRLMDGLQNLLPQSQLESGCARLTTANTAISSHMNNQTRTLRDLSFTINSASLPAPETAELLMSLIELIPRPAQLPLQELSRLHHQTLSLVSQLSFLSDSLHMVRQSTIAANRKLRVAKEACADWRSEIEMVDKARRWIEDGDWDAKCRRREAAVVCKDVTSGFEDVCRGFEEKLRAQEVAA